MVRGDVTRSPGEPCGCTGAAGAPLWRVIILNDGDPTLPAFVAMDRAMRAALTAPGRHPVDLFPRPSTCCGFPGAVRGGAAGVDGKKYAGHAGRRGGRDRSALARLRGKHSARLWPQARIVFTGVAVEVLAGRRLGRVRPVSPAARPRRVADLALRLRPSTRRLVVISDRGVRPHDGDRRANAARAPREAAGHRVLARSVHG